MEKEEDSDDTFVVDGTPSKILKILLLKSSPSLPFLNTTNRKTQDSMTVVSGDELEVAGMKYRLVLNVNDGCNEGTNIYEAEVYVRVWDDYSELIYMKPIN
ncbi:hypothetical protein HID58_094933 [Brassica napus]|uniref:Cysteine proteinase inhibitor n=1 Tax=Brassica napus TaxID=3708 RepID=A0ABQ7X5U8_BRANA|nr:hypothetical protein HID58_094933 [Brassica napus]